MRGFSQSAESYHIGYKSKATGHVFSARAGDKEDGDVLWSTAFGTGGDPSIGATYYIVNLAGALLSLTFEGPKRWVARYP